MPSDDLWPSIHAERAALADDLEGLTDAQWQTQSLCSGWSVREVLAHLTGAATTSFPKFVVRFTGAGFRPSAMLERLIDENLGQSPSDTLARFKSHVHSTTVPLPMLPKAQYLGEVVVHGEDIRTPLGIERNHPPQKLQLLADYYRKVSLDGSKRRASGLSFHASDALWSSGEGPEVIGPGIAIVQAITGRAAGLDRLTGDGVATLKARF